MNRSNLLDNIRGCALIFMTIHHIFYFYDVGNNFTTSYRNHAFVNMCGIIARTTFIVLSGYSLYMSYKNSKNNEKKTLQRRFSRSANILANGMIITLVSYMLFPDRYIRFGILHFIAVCSLLIAPLAPYKRLTILAFIASLTMTYPKINPFIDTITGTVDPYSTIDVFPLNKWLPYMLFGLIIGQNVDINNIGPSVPNNKLTYLGQNSLALYTIQVIFLLVLAKLESNNI